MISNIFVYIFQIFLKKEVIYLLIDWSIINKNLIKHISTVVYYNSFAYIPMFYQFILNNETPICIIILWFHPFLPQNFNHHLESCRLNTSLTIIIEIFCIPVIQLKTWHHFCRHSRMLTLAFLGFLLGL